MGGGRAQRMASRVALASLLAGCGLLAGTSAPRDTALSYTIAWIPNRLPALNLPSVSLASFEDPTNPTEGPQPTFPHPNVETPSGPALAVGQPILIAPQSSDLGTTLSGTLTTSAAVTVTVSEDGTVLGSVTKPNAATLTIDWTATVADVYASAGVVPQNAPVLAGSWVLAPTANDVTPTTSLVPGRFGSLCSPSATAASDALFAQLTPALAQSAAGKLSPLVATPTSQDVGTCAIQFAAPSGLSGGTTWTVDVQLAASLSATTTAQLAPLTVTINGTTLTIPAGTYADVAASLPSWILGPATALTEQVATVESLPTGPVSFGGAL
jgi:hypothetical protein